MTNAANIRVGLLGFSDIARRRFIPALPASGCAVLAAIGTRRTADIPVRDSIRTAHPQAAICSYEELIARPDVDLIYNSLPNHLHEEWTLRALAAGKHVLCEKPLAPSLESVERMIAAANKSGRLLFENLMFMQHPQHAVVKDLLETGRIGTLRTVRSVFGFNLTDPANFRLDPARGGGACADLLTYTVGTADLFNLRDLCDPTGLIFRRDALDIAAHGTALCGGEREQAGSGIAFTFSIGMNQHYESAYELTGDAGQFRLDRAYTTPPGTANTLRIRTPSGEETVTLPAADHFALTIRLAARIIATASTFEHLHAQALRRHRTIAAIKSALRPVQ